MVSLCEHRSYTFDEHMDGLCLGCGMRVRPELLLARHLTRIETKIDGLIYALIPEFKND